MTKYHCRYYADLNEVVEADTDDEAREHFRLLIKDVLNDPVIHVEEVKAHE